MSEDKKSLLWPYVRAQADDAGGLWAEKRRLASAMRRVIEHLVVTDAPPEQLAAAADRLSRFADALEEYPRSSSFPGFAESANAGDVHAFFDQSPLIGLSNPLAPPIWLQPKGERVGGHAVFGSAYEGPPGCVHGGFVAAAFDEVLGFAQSVTGNPGMTGTLTVRYRRPTPLHRELIFDAGVDRVEGRKIFASATIAADGEITAEAEGIFISLDAVRFGEMMAKKNAGDGRDGSGMGGRRSE